MAQLGTLWFGADIDMTKLQQKIKNGNQSILDALKISYDQASYQQMVSRLRADLAKERFEIKLSTNTQNVVQNVKNAVRGGISGSAIPDLDNLSKEILQRRQLVNDLAAAVARDKAAYAKLGGQSRKNRLIDSRAELEQEKAALQNAIARRKAYNDGIRETARAQRQAAREQRQAAAETARTQRQAAAEAKRLQSESLRLNATLANGVHVSTQFGSALSSLFAVDLARQALGNVIEIGGQLEKQRISIGAILGDTVKANHLFEQIKGLAIKSPFGVVELDQYTKQLSAYGFKYNELFDMTKRLADISAGAGQDIGRLTLALGHVRSATYLTGITLRQFSMNNIPMLKMLADYYTELEGRIVSTAEVQKRISKRQVSYEDVIEQIRRLTDEGGMFYNMQEKISESLAAKFKNLRDAMDIMYGEMAEGFIGDKLKGLAEGLLQLTRHWKEFALVMATAAGGFLAMRIGALRNTLALRGTTAATLKQIMATKQLEANNLRAAGTYRTLTFEERRKILTANQLTAADARKALTTKELSKDQLLTAIALRRMTEAEAQALVMTKTLTQKEVEAALAAKRWKVELAGVSMALKNAFSGIGMGTWLTVGAMVGMELYSSYTSWVDRIDSKTQEMKDLIKSRIIDLDKMQSTINKEEKPKDKTALQARIDDMKQVLANSEEYTKSLDEQLSKSSGLSEQYDILAKSIEEATEKNRKMFDYQESIGRMIKASSLGDANGIFDHGFWDLPLLNYLFNDDITKNIAQTMDAYKDLRQVIEGAWEYREAIKGVIEEMMMSEEVSDSFKEKLRNAPFEEQVQLLAESGYWDMLKSKVISQEPMFAEFADKLKTSADSVEKRWEEIANDDLPKMLRKEAAARGINEKELREWALENIDDFSMMLDGIADQLDLKEPSIRKRLKRLAYDYVSFAGISQAIVEGEEIGRMIGGEDNLLKKLLDYDDKADLHDRSSQDAGKNGDKNKKDKALEEAKTKLEQYKAFLSEYKKYREMYSKEKAIDLLEKLFPDLKGQGRKLVDDYIGMLDRLRNDLPATTEARKKFINDISKTKADTVFDREKEKIKENAEVMDEYIKKIEEQWKLYRSLLKKSGGNKDFAQLAFGENGAIWDETAKKLLQEFNRRGEELGVVPVGFNWNMNEKQMQDALVDAKGQVQDELVKLALEIKKVIGQNYVKFLEDSAEAYSKSLTAAQKLVELEQQREDLVRAKASDNDKSEAKQRGWDAQIAAKDKEIISQRWEAFKEAEQWGRIFGNLDNLTTDTLTDLLEKLKELAPTINEDADSMKALYEAIEKIDDVISKRNPFAAMGESLSKSANIRKLMKDGLSDYGFRNEDGTFTIGVKDAIKLGLTVKKSGKYTEKDLRNAQKAAEGDFTTALSDLEQSFRAVQDVLAPVIDLFEQLGDEAMSTLFSTAGNAFGSAVQVAGGLKTLGLGNLGPYGAAAAAALSITSSLFALHDKAIQQEIESSKARQEEMENLTKNLEKALERTLGGIYTTKATSEMLKTLNNELKINMGPLGGEKYRSYFGQDTINATKEAERTKSYYDATYASLLAQRDEIKHQMQLEEKRKNADDDTIADYDQELKEMNDQIKNFALDMAKALYDIDIKSWADDLGSALYDAWQKGEDAAEAFKKKASEIIADLAKEIAVTKLIETAMQPVMEAITSEMEKKKGQLDEQSINAISSAMNLVGSTLPQSFNNLMEGLNEGMMKAGLTDMKQLNENTESSSASNSIKSITETTADLLASYINAIRADVSVMRAEQSIDLPAINIAVQRTSVLAEAQVQLQTQIAANTLRNADAADRIYDIMHKIDTGITKIKVG